MKIGFEVLTPETPDKIRIDQGKERALVLDIKDLTQEQATEFATLLKNTFLAKWAEVKEEYGMERLMELPDSAPPTSLEG